MKKSIKITSLNNLIKTYLSYNFFLMLMLTQNYIKSIDDFINKFFFKEIKVIKFLQRKKSLKFFFSKKIKRMNRRLFFNIKKHQMLYNYMKKFFFIFFLSIKRKALFNNFMIYFKTLFFLPVEYKNLDLVPYFKSFEKFSLFFFRIYNISFLGYLRDTKNRFVKFHSFFSKKKWYVIRVIFTKSNFFISFCKRVVETTNNMNRIVDEPLYTLSSGKIGYKNKFRSSAYVIEKVTNLFCRAINKIFVGFIKLNFFKNRRCKYFRVKKLARQYLNLSLFIKTCRSYKLYKIVKIIKKKLIVKISEKKFTFLKTHNGCRLRKPRRL
mgnify:CR=1 FL=1